jgi:hypothetical protein
VITNLQQLINTASWLKKRSKKKLVKKINIIFYHTPRAPPTQHQVKLEIETSFNGEDFSETLMRAMFQELSMDLFCGTLKVRPEGPL